MDVKEGMQLGPYVIENPLSKAGGMSQVFLAYDINRPQHRAALKVQLANDKHSVVFKELLRKETDALKNLRHPGIIHIYPLHIDGRSTHVACAYDLPGKPWYFAMEYLWAGTLDTYMEKIKKFPIEWSMELFYQLLITIDYMHQLGYAHCDLKPQNIFLRYPPDPHLAPVPVIVDFGSAVIIEKGIQQVTVSLRYAAPESIASHTYPHYDYLKQAIKPDKLDIWGLGTLLFEIITGRQLIQGPSKDEITTTIIRNELDTISGLRKGNSSMLRSLDKILLMMCANNPASRPTTTTLIKAIEERIIGVHPPRIPLK